IDFKIKKFEEMLPHVASMSPFPNGARDADPAVRQLTFTFDRPLDPKAGYSMNWGKEGAEHYPVGQAIGLNDMGTLLTVEVKLNPDWEYEFVLTGLAFKTKDGYPLQPYTVKFRTTKASD